MAKFKDSLANKIMKTMQVNVMFTAKEFAQFERHFQKKVKSLEPGMRLTRSGFARLLIMGILMVEPVSQERIGSDG